MSKETSLKMVGSWTKEMHTSLSSALSNTYEVSGRSMAEACRHAMILMMQSARSLTRQAPKNRKVQRDSENHGARYIECYRKGQALGKIFKFQYDKTDSRLKGTWNDAKLIGNRGLAKRSWMWGARKLRGNSGSKELPGASSLYTIKKHDVGGYIKTNRLEYIRKAMPPGWEHIVEMRVANKIMKQAQMKLERRWQRAVNRSRASGVPVGADIGKYLLRT